MRPLVIDTAALGTILVATLKALPEFITIFVTILAGVYYTIKIYKELKNKDINSNLE